MILLLIVALLPPLYLLRAVYRLDKIEKEPAGFIRSLVLWGVIAVIPAVILEMAAQYAFELMGINPLSTIGLLIDNFIGVALVEEGVKYFFLSRKTFKSPEFNFRFDGIVYAVAVSLGFAAAENIMYTFMYGLGASLFRAVTSIPGHAVFAIYMGHYYGTAKYMYEQGEVDASRSYRRLALWIPVLLHGFYDYTLSTQSTWMVLVFILYVVVLDVIALRSIRRFASDDMPVSQTQSQFTEMDTNAFRDNIDNFEVHDPINSDNNDRYRPE